MMDKSRRIFSGDYSKKMWNEINAIETAEDAKWALYLVCCRLQELEATLASVVKGYESRIIAQHTIHVPPAEDTK